MMTVRRREAGRSLVLARKSNSPRSLRLLPSAADTDTEAARAEAASTGDSR
jgi:hypothetical protein